MVGEGVGIRLRDGKCSRESMRGWVYEDVVVVVEDGK